MNLHHNPVVSKYLYSHTLNQLMYIESVDVISMCFCFLAYAYCT